MRARASALALGVIVAIGACDAPATNADRYQKVTREEAAPEQLILPGQDQRADSAALALPGRYFDTDEEGEKDSLPRLPYGMTLGMITDGDRLFRGKGGCVNCHGSEAQGLAARGAALTSGLRFIPVGQWQPIDSLIHVGMPDRLTRTTIAMPPRGQNSDLDADETRAIAAYVWAISQVKGEPWPGGHAIHAPHDWRASARTSIP
jgi:hypothetical protein